MTSRDELGERGAAIWTAYGAEGLPAGNQALVLEIARTADGLDKLNALLVGCRDEWAKVEFDDMGEVILEVTPLLSERRQQQMAFKQLLGEARQLGLKQTGGTELEEEPAGRSGLILSLVRDADAG